MLPNYLKMLDGSNVFWLEAIQQLWNHELWNHVQNIASNSVRDARLPVVSLGQAEAEWREQ